MNLKKRLALAALSDMEKQEAMPMRKGPAKSRGGGKRKGSAKRKSLKPRRVEFDAVMQSTSSNTLTNEHRNVLSGAKGYLNSALDQWASGLIELRHMRNQLLDDESMSDEMRAEIDKDYNKAEEYFDAAVNDLYKALKAASDKVQDLEEDLLSKQILTQKLADKYIQD